MRSPCTHRRALLLSLAGLSWPALAYAPPPEVERELPGARLQGQGRYTFLGLLVYDARLWVGPGFDARTYERHVMALELAYGRSLDGPRIAERSLTEMKKVGSVTDAQAARWLAHMKRAFPDVDSGDRITGLYRPSDTTQFFFNAQPRGQLQDAEFASLFFGIWLSAHTSEPKLRKDLLGLDAP